MNIVFVVSNSGALTASELAIQSRLVTTLGHTVTVVDDQAAAPSLVGVSLVVFAPDCNYNFISTKYNNATCGVFSMRIEPHTEMTDSTFPSGGNTASTVFIDAPGDPLVGGLTGTVNVLSGTPSLSYQYFAVSSFSAGSTIVGLSSSGGTRALLARIAQGGQLHNGQVATTRRVFWGINETWPELFNTNGWAIFENAVTWASATPGLLPVANAGPDQEVTTGAVVQLNGNASSDSDGTVQQYTWRVVSNTGPGITLSSTTVVNPTFTAPNVACSIVLGLIVTDNDGLQFSEDTVRIDVLAHMQTRIALNGSWAEKPLYVAKGGVWY
jgi:hypothetical protein